MFYLCIYLYFQQIKTTKHSKNVTDIMKKTCFYSPSKVSYFHLSKFLFFTYHFVNRKHTDQKKVDSWQIRNLFCQFLGMDFAFDIKQDTLALLQTLKMHDALETLKLTHIMLYTSKQPPAALHNRFLFKSVVFGSNQ